MTTEVTTPGALGMPAKLRLAAEILVAYGRVRWILRRRGLPATLALLRRPPAIAPPLPVDAVTDGRRLGRATVRLLTLVPADTRCLMRSLVLTRLLAHRGIESRLVIAVAPGESFAAHAWVEHAGLPLLAPESPRFAPLVTL